jgi:prepilin-type N-terminal cleavage/methylation domain-containing protein/prepilin-type processing-associated H-X9-DG protein
MARGKAFTLVELLVVIAVISLLLAILVPALEKARRQARAAACQVNLRQWGTALAAFAEDNDGLFPHVDYSASDGEGALWILTGRSLAEITNGQLQPPRQYHPISTKGMLCPETTIVQDAPGKPSTGWGFGGTTWHYGVEWGGTNRPWVLTVSGGPTNEVQVSYVSYGLNGWLFQQRPGVFRTSKERAEANMKSSSSYTNIFLLRRTAGVPLLLDGTYYQGSPTEGAHPPWQDGGEEGAMGGFCINRHSEHINALFLDWSVRKVGLKELWMLKWHQNFNTTGPWTKAGGATPDKWPPWMRGFKDY